MTTTPPPDPTGPPYDATALLTHARALYQTRGELRDHPDQIYDVLRAIQEATRYLDDIVEEASNTYQARAATAVSMFGDEVRGPQTAMYAAGYLNAAAHILRSLREQLMHGTADVDRLMWPQHDPVAAEQLRDYRHLFDQRAQDVDLDQDTSPTNSPTPDGTRSNHRTGPPRRSPYRPLAHAMFREHRARLRARRQLAAGAVALAVTGWKLRRRHACGRVGGEAGTPKPRGRPPHPGDVHLSGVDEL